MVKKLPILAVILSSLFVITSCKSPVSPNEPKDVPPPNGKYEITSSKSTILYEYFVFGQTMMKDTLDSTITFKPVNSIVEIRSDSTILYRNDSVATTRFAVVKGKGFFSENFDTATVNKNLEAVLKQLLPEVTIVNPKITKYSVTNKPFTYVNSELNIPTSFSATCQFSNSGVAATVVITGSTVQIGKVYTGNIPPLNWPQNKVVGNLNDIFSDMLIPLLPK